MHMFQLNTTQNILITRSFHHMTPRKNSVSDDLVPADSLFASIFEAR
jgi:hypothetical protein